MRLTTQVCPASFTLASPAGAIYAAKPTSICLYVVVNNQRNFSQKQDHAPRADWHGQVERMLDKDRENRDGPETVHLGHPLAPGCPGRHRVMRFVTDR